MKVTSLVAILSLTFYCGSSAFAQTVDWIRQLGTSSRDMSNGVSSDGLGNVYIAASTNGSLDGNNAGSEDVYLSKYDANGELEWIQQLGSSSFDRSYGVSADRQGNIYISGDTWGSLGETNAGGGDAFLSKYNANGTLQWTRQFGTSDWDYCTGVSSDGLGNVYISGFTDGDLGGSNAGLTDAFISKYDTNGMLQWIRQFGTSSRDKAYSVSADGSGNVFISGDTGGSLGGAYAGDGDAFVAKILNDVHELEADFNDDGDVDGGDFLAWQRGESPNPLISSDLADWEANFGDVENVEASSTQVPEPTCLLLLCLGIAVGSLRIRGQPFNGLS